MEFKMASTTTTTEKVTQIPTPCVDIEPATNVKCIVFTVFIIGIYWFLPRNKWFLLLLLYLPYLLMAWYDEWYNCEREFGPTYLRMFYEWAKPPGSKQSIAYKNWCPKHANKVFVVDMIILVLFLIFFFGFFLKWQPKTLN